MDIDSSIWNLMAKKITGALSFREEQMLNAWINQNPGGKEISTELEQIWEHAGQKGGIQHVPDEEIVWEKLAHQVNTYEQSMAMKALGRGADHSKTYRKQATRGNRWGPGKLSISRALLVASMIAILVISTVHFSGYKGMNKATSYPVISFSEFNRLPEKNVEISLSSDSLQVYMLPDKSRVWLNKNTRISYPPDFGDSVRSIWLTGEAFFEIQEDRDKPFIISANGSETRVVGTAFNLKAYEKEDPVLTVVNGKVEFSGDKSRKEKLVLIKGERGTFNRKRGRLIKEKNEEDHFLDWKHILVYRKEISFPSNYLRNEARWKKSLINQTEIRGEIHNIASLATYKNVKLRVSYHKKRKKKNHIITVYKSLGPGETISYKYRLADWFGKTQDLRIEVVDASVSKN
ncbi:MAG: FecR family protein [Cytophagales bacterium]|nr:FecR family protein [Cytophagales bacterium]